MNSDFRLKVKVCAATVVKSPEVILMDRNGKATVVALFGILVILLIGMLMYARNTSPSNAMLRSGRFLGIKVTGHSEMMVSPDMAKVSLGIVTREPTSKQAAEKNAAVAQSILNAIKGTGVAAKDVRTTGYAIEPWIKYTNTSSRQLGYEVHNTMQVTARDLGKISDVIDAGIKAGANDVRGVSFGLADEEGLRRKALSMAVKNARQKADAIAGTLGVGVGDPLSVTEQGEYTPMYDQPVLFSAPRREVAAQTPISPGEQEITYDVEVSFSIR